MEELSDRETYPSSIQYLLDIPDNIPKPTWTFIVGKPNMEKQIIKAYTPAMMAHSTVFRSMLMDSKLAETKPVTINDIEPRIFKKMLVFMYGHKKVSGMTIVESLDLLYAAEKYMVDELKKELDFHISSLVTLDNIFIVLQRQVCFNQESVMQAITKIVQSEIHILLSKPEFLDLHSSKLLYILQQDSLSVPEIDLWRAVLRWAKHTAETDNGPVLRDQLLDHLKYIRFCTLTLRDFVKEVVLADILTENEVFLIIRTFGSNIEEQNLTTVCNTLTLRKLELPEVLQPGLQLPATTMSRHMHGSKIILPFADRVTLDEIDF